VHPAPLPYQGKLLVHKGTSLCSLPAVVHRGGGPTPWHSLTLTGLHKMSLQLPSIARLCLLLTTPIPPHNYSSQCMVHVLFTVVI
jgi:hypothetical protein